jgi:hypothetical protein
MLGLYDACAISQSGEMLGRIDRIDRTLRSANSEHKAPLTVSNGLCGLCAGGLCGLCVRASMRLGMSASCTFCGVSYHSIRGLAYPAHRPHRPHRPGLNNNLTVTMIVSDSPLNCSHDCNGHIHLGFSQA